MNGNALIWWNRLSDEEQMVMVALLYQFEVWEFMQYGIEVDDYGKYVKVERVGIED